MLDTNTSAAVMATNPPTDRRTQTDASYMGDIIDRLWVFTAPSFVWGL